MPVTRAALMAGSISILVAVPLVVAMAQTQSPPPSPQSPPAATKPETSAPPAAPQTTPSAPSPDKKVATPAPTNLVGLTAKSSDGTNLGTVHSVIANPGGKTTIGVKVGGFLGFGGHMVAIPDGKFNRVGDTVQVNMTADEVHKLPQAVEQK
jgi:PRC-barrel domain